jgi:hypothetical protein
LTSEVNTPTVVDWLTAIATIAAVVVALFVAFLSSIRRWYNRPRFEIEFGNEEPFSRHANAITGSDEYGITRTVPTYWIRIRIKNAGRSIARGCETKLVRITQTSDMRDRSDFDPVVLHWVGSSSNPIDINKQEYEYLDVVYMTISDPNRFYIAGEEKAPRAINLAPPRQDYLLHIVVYGANAEPLEKTLLLRNAPQYDRIRLELA